MRLTTRQLDFCVRFPFRKCREGSGEFRGAFYTQHENGEITYQQQDYAKRIRPISISKDKKPWLLATEKEISVNGALGWISSQSRPDLAVQTSLSQQSFPAPTIQDLLAANQAVRRCRQQSDLVIRVPFIEPSKLTICFWSDAVAAFANSANYHTQAGWLLGFTSTEFSKGTDVPVHCMAWKSYKLPRVASSDVVRGSPSVCDGVRHDRVVPAAVS